MTADGFSVFVFGKRFRDLNENEKKEYWRLTKTRSRNLDPKSKEKAKAYYELNKEKINEQTRDWYKNNKDKARENRKKYNEKVRGGKPFCDSLTRQMFGCKYTEMTEEQKKLYNTTRHLRYRKSQRQKKLEKTENSLD